MLPHLGPEHLPMMAFAFPAATELPSTATFQEIRNQADLPRPTGGLWCSPVARRPQSSAPATTDWINWCNAPERIPRPFLHQSSGRPYDTAVIIEPLPEARVYQIDTAEDLDRLCSAYPLPRPSPLLPIGPDWEKMTTDGLAAVYVSAAGLAANDQRFFVAEPSLYGWDCPSVLWLKPAYRVGAEWQISSAE